MTFTDILKDSIIEGFNTDVTTTKICVTLGFALIIGLYIFLVYRYKSKSSFYSKDFNNVLAILPVVTSGIVLAMQSSIVISLGMVGALSIVRFRNAIKSSLDLAFLFWSISIGIIVGAGLYEIAFILSFIVTLLMFGLDFIPIKKAPYLLVINAENIDVEEDLTLILDKLTSAYTVKSRSQNGDILDLIIEIRTSQAKELMKECLTIKNIKNITLLSHDGESRF